ncbi:uncharacterized protein LOC106664636 [Cimex lectularius]|uniref:Uncharacterized protein n=1 Tax=Cimex lectularius TaxID=79782 RepID=A0A8I6RIE6_CIMLE|nr:uncharacterized protein LOC106664636 [Cimex lectularius]
MSGPGCCAHPKRLGVHALDALSLTVVVMFQGTVLNYYIISHYKDSVTPYFLFAADALCISTFIGTLVASYSYLVRVYVCKDAEDGIGTKIRARLKSSAPKIGVMPLSYVSWLFYVVILVTKIVVIFESGLAESLNPMEHFGPQLLKVTIASSSFVFLLLAEGHNWVKRGLPRNAYVTTVCAKTGIEIFDSVSLLSIILEGPKELTEGFKDLVLGLAAINFFLPSVKLYQLSFPDLSINTVAKTVTMIYMLAHIVLIDIPFLSVRLYLWLNFRQNASMFLMKNVLSIVLTLRGMYPELISFKHGFFLAEGNTKSEEEPNLKNPKESGDEVICLTRRNAGKQEKELSKVDSAQLHDKEKTESPRRDKEIELETLMVIE